MILELGVSLITLACIIAFVVWLAMQPQKRILQIAVPVCVISFVIIYTFYLVARLVPDDPVFGIPAAFSAFVETFGSFTNGVAYSDVAESDAVMEVFSVFWFETLFWALHMLVIITLAISGFAVFGRKLMDRVRYRLHMLFAKESIYFIFGDTEGALIFGKNLVEQARSATLDASGESAEEGTSKPFVVYFSYEYSEELREQIADFGGALIEVTENSRTEYLRKAAKANKDNIVIFEGLVRPMVKGWDAKDEDESKGYDIADLLARKVVKDHAPYICMLARRNSSGSEDDELVNPRLNIPEQSFAGIIVGFGEIGSACLKQLIMTSQLNLNGTKPKFYVISRNGVSFDRFLIENPGIGECADIVFLEADIYSFEAEAVIDQAMHDECSPLRQIYVCCAPVQATTPEEGTAFRDMNKEIIGYLDNLVRCIGPTGSHGLDMPNVEFVNPCKEERDIWTPDIILHKGLDKRAMSLNYSYWLPDESEGQAERERFEREISPDDAWNSTGSLDKDSSRAAADFMEAFYALVGIEPNDVGSKNEYSAMLKREDVVEALAQIEHNRWKAFHYCNGFTKMPKLIFEERAELECETKAEARAKAVAKAEAQGGKSAEDIEKMADEAWKSTKYFRGDDKPHRDARRKLHPCLVPWEELPALDSVYALYKGEGCTPLQRSDEDSPNKAFDFVGK